MSKFTIVTSPDYYFMDQPSILSYGLDINNERVCNYINDVDVDVTVYLGTPSSDLNWLINVSRSVDYILLNTNVDMLVTGLLIDKPNTYYYNNIINFDILNKQQIEDPVAFLISWLNKLEV